LDWASREVKIRGLKTVVEPKRQRKKKYIPNLAASRFKPTEDWSVDKARTRYAEAAFPFKVDRVLYEDCVEGMERLPTESVDVVVADPPFGLGFTGKESIYNRDGRFVQGGYQEAAKAEYEDFSVRWLQAATRVLKKSGSAWIFSGWTHIGEVLNAINETDLKVTNHVIWRYQFGVFTMRKFVTSHYHLVFATKDSDYYFNKIMHYPQDVWDIKRTYRRGEVKNGTKLPEELVGRCIEFTSRPGELVLDPFMGNGTTAVAARGTFRHYLGFEMNPAMKPVVDRNVSLTKPGSMYTPYSEREDEMVTRAKERYGPTATPS
jgi:site-specific DNA-methyltransferase (adenine-specific)